MDMKIVLIAASFLVLGLNQMILFKRIIFVKLQNDKMKENLSTLIKTVSCQGRLLKQLANSDAILWQIVTGETLK